MKLSLLLRGRMRPQRTAILIFIFSALTLTALTSITSQAQTTEPTEPVSTASTDELQAETAEVTAEAAVDTAGDTAAEATPEAVPGGLTAVDAAIIQRQDVFGSEALFVEGTLENTSTSDAYTGIELYAELYDSSDELIGEGFGFPVNACGTGLVADFTLQPRSSQNFSIQAELYEDGVEIDRIEVFPDGAVVEAEAINPFLSFPGVTRITTGEVVNVEWIDDSTLRYAVGCDADVFTNQTWFSYDLTTGRSAPIEHPNASAITDAMLLQTGLTDPANFNHSFLTFHPTSTRMIYQTDINTILTAERDGSFKRLLYDDLARVSLHGYIWLPDGRFLAYYYGAYGDEVRYFTASLAGQLISGNVYDVQPSRTIPGPFPDGALVVIGATIGEQTGYFLTSTLNHVSELLFEFENLPGNNYPAPLYAPDAGGDHRIYFVLPDAAGGQPQLQCFHRPSGTLTPLTRLPLRITSDDRAWTWLSPDQGTIALAANGSAGGLWLIALADLGDCAAETDG